MAKQAKRSPSEAQEMALEDDAGGLEEGPSPDRPAGTAARHDAPARRRPVPDENSLNPHDPDAEDEPRGPGRTSRGA